MERQSARQGVERRPGRRREGAALLDLPEPVQEHVDRGDLAASVAYEVSRLESPAEQAELAERVVAEKMTRDQVAGVVKARKEGRATSMPATARVELKLDGGRKLSLSGLPDDRPETVWPRSPRQLSGTVEGAVSRRDEAA